MNPLKLAIFAFWSSWLGIVGFAFRIKSFQEWGRWGYVLLALAFVGGIWMTFHELTAWRKQKRFDKAAPIKIRDYMYNWINTGGRVAIWTRDHTWVNDDPMRELLMKKAQNRELVLCLPCRTDLSEKLACAGAQVVYHGTKDPRVRFTITHYNQAGMHLAVAKIEKDHHIIEEYDQSQPITALACDLVALAQANEIQNGK